MEVCFISYWPLPSLPSALTFYLAAGRTLRNVSDSLRTQMSISNCFYNRDHPWWSLLQKLCRFHYRFALKSPGLRISMLLKLYLVMNLCIERQCSNNCHVLCDLNSPMGIDSKAEREQAQSILPGHLQLVLRWISILKPFSLFLIYCSSKVRIVNHTVTRKRWKELLNS